MKSEPKIRFPEFDDSYSCSYLSDYLTVNTARNKDGAYSKEDVLSVSGEEGIVNQIQLLGRSYAGVSVLDYHIVNLDDIVYTKSPLKASPFGIIKCNKGQSGIVSTLYAVYTPKESVLPSYVEDYFALDSRLNRYLKPIVRIGAKHDMKVSNSAVLEGEVSFPSLSEQKKIADFLSAYAKKMSLQKERVGTLEERKKGLLQKVFSQEIRFKTDDGSEFPEWEEKTIGDIADCIAGATPNTKVSDYWENGTIPWMSSGEVNKETITETERRISQIGYDKTSTKIVPPNTVVMALAGQGKTRGMVAITRIPLCTNQSLASLVAKKEFCPDYLYQYLITQYSNLRSISSGDDTRGGLNLKLVGAYPVRLPCIFEQRKIAGLFTVIDSQISLERERLKTMQEIKKGLLQQMFC